MKGEKKKTFTYAGSPSQVVKGKDKAIKNGTTLSELIDEFVKTYSESKRKKFLIVRISK